MASTSKSADGNSRPVRSRTAHLTVEELAEILEQSDFYDTDGEQDFVPGDYRSDSDLSSEDLEVPDASVSSQENDDELSNDGNDSFVPPVRPMPSRAKRTYSSKRGTLAIKPSVKKRDTSSKAAPGNRKTTSQKRLESKQWKDIEEDFDIEPNFPNFEPVPSNVHDRQAYSPIDYFNEYFDSEIFKKLADNTNVHHLQTNNKMLNTTESEIHTFVGITLLMSSLGFPRIRMYWSHGYGIPLIADNMTRNRYFTLRNTIHVVNNFDVTNEEKEQDKLWKVRPILDAFHAAVMRLPREQNVSIDKQMIPFAGHVGIRQYVPSKPNPTGLKNYVLPSANGKILDFEIYQGKTTKFPEDTEKSNLGSGGRAVLRLSVTCPPGTNMYFDRYFTSVTLLDKLKEKGILGTGTTMSNRFPNVGFPTDYEMKKMGRGTIKSKVRENKDLALIRWMDNRAVTMASTCHTVKPIYQCKRYSKPDQRYIDVPQPAVVRNYNLNMGGVDLVNRMIAAYRSYHKTKKWPVRVIEHFMDCAAVNTWLQYREACAALKVKNSVLDLMHFQMRIAECLLKGVSSTRDESEEEAERTTPQGQKKKVGRPGTVPLPPPEVAKYKALHLPKAMDLQDAQRCRNPGCKQRTRVKCISCNIYLCVVKDRDCFIEFHS